MQSEYKKTLSINILCTLLASSFWNACNFESWMFPYTYMGCEVAMWKIMPLQWVTSVNLILCWHYLYPDIWCELGSGANCNVQKQSAKEEFLWGLRDPVIMKGCIQKLGMKMWLHSWENQYETLVGWEGIKNTWDNSIVFRLSGICIRDA